MARNDGVHHTVARNGKYTRSQIGNLERHNERKNEVYQNTDIDLQRSAMNVHFKKPMDGYIATFDQMCKDSIISTKGIKDNAIHYNELLLDVNTSYFEERGGYKYARTFFAKAYEYAVQEIGGEQYILSAVMHADERNSAVSDELSKDVYHYHMHIIYVPVVQKEVKWSKRCKDPALVGTVKEVITQVSHSKKWASHKEVGADGKPHLVKSYVLLQDRFYEFMHQAGYTDIERGEKGSTAQNIMTTELKVQKEKERLQDTVAELHKASDVLHEQIETIDQNNQTITGQNTQITKGNAQLEKVASKKAKVKNIERIETKSALFSSGKIVVDEGAFATLKTLAQKQVASASSDKKQKATIKALQQENQTLKQTNEEQKKELSAFQSVRAKLHATSDQIRITELEKFQEAVYQFLDKMGFRKAFDDFIKRLSRPKVKQKDTSI